MNNQPNAIRLGGITPILRVANLDASLEYYVNVLGFGVQWEDKRVIAAVSRGNAGIFLCEGDQGHPGTWVWIGADDVDRVHEEFRSKGAKIRQEPTNFAWALEVQVEDLDGNVLRIGSDRRPDAPNGPWLDMEGHRWMPTEDGRWTPI